MEGFEYICMMDELQENVGRRFIVNDVEVAVFKINSEVFAVSNICPHQQTHLIYRWIYRKWICRLSCPWLEVQFTNRKEGIGK